MSSNATYNDDGSWSFYSVYNFPSFEKKLIKHFEDGGGLKPIILSGLLGVSESTIDNWMDIASPHYKEEFSQCIGKHKGAAAYVVDTQRRLASVGEYADWDAKLLSQRYKETVEDNGNVGLSKETKTALMGDDLKKSILCLQKDFARNRINPAQFEMLTKTLISTQDVNMREMQEQLNELIEKLGN